MNFLGFSLRNNLFVAPMAGVTDRPFRQLCKRLGAAYAVSEMVTSNSLLYGSNKTLRRADHTGESEPIAVQIAGADPVMMANAARLNVERGAQVIDINMGCPAKKICNAMAGSALLKNEALVERILTAVVAAVPDTPVTLKIRTGWDQHNINAGNILGIAESAGIRALTVHGRTRSQQYSGQAEYDTIKRLKAAARIPIIANGDIDSPQKARQVLDYTGVDAIMIGRAAQGKPWLFREIEHYLTTGEYLPAPKVGEIHHLLRTHLDELYHFYGRETGAKIARKHISWYTKGMTNSADFRRFVNRLATENEQIAAIDGFFKTFAAENEDLGYRSKEEAAL